VTLRHAVEYVAAAYLLVWVAVLAYMLLIGQKVRRMQAELERLEAAVAAAEGSAPAGTPRSEAPATRT
jgi:CcmD family protein